MKDLRAPLLNMDDVADLLKMKRDTIKKLVQADGIPHVRISPRIVRFEKDAVLKWVAERRFTPARKPLALLQGGRR